MFLGSKELGIEKGGPMSWSNEGSSENLDVCFRSLDNGGCLIEERRVGCNCNPMVIANPMRLCIPALPAG